jgi:hypothetical protein
VVVVVVVVVLVVVAVAEGGGIERERERERERATSVTLKQHRFHIYYCNIVAVYPSAHFFSHKFIIFEPLSVAQERLKFFNRQGIKYVNPLSKKPIYISYIEKISFCLSNASAANPHFV